MAAHSCMKFSLTPLRDMNGLPCELTTRDGSQVRRRREGVCPLTYAWTHEPPNSPSLYTLSTPNFFFVNVVAMSSDALLLLDFVDTCNHMLVPSVHL